MTIYQEEMQRKAQHYGCLTDYAEADQLLLISYKGAHLTAINPEGFMFYNSKDISDPDTREVFLHLVDDAETVREYVGLYERSPHMKPKDVQNYRKLSEYGDVVFAGIDNLQLYDGTSVTILESVARGKLLSTNKSGYRGVFQTPSGKWCAQITFKRKTYHLGTFEDIMDAVRARKRGEEMHDEFLEWYYANVKNKKKEEE